MFRDDCSSVLGFAEIFEFCCRGTNSSELRMIFKPDNQLHAKEKNAEENSAVLNIGVDCHGREIRKMKVSAVLKVGVD